MKKIIVDSALSREEALKQNPVFHCPEEVLSKIVVIGVDYFGFDSKIHSGQLAIHKDLAEDIKGAFKLLLSEKFPIQTVIPVSANNFTWDDTLSTAANNTSAFNYRYVRDTTDMSHHSTGRAIDINPALNPYFPKGKVFPLYASYNINTPGTILHNSNLVKYFEGLGWRWGGSWSEDLDYQHFEKL